MSQEVFFLFTSGMVALAVASISGLVLMYRQIGELRVELKHLSRAIETLAAAGHDERASARDEIRRLHERIDSMKESR